MATPIQGAKLLARSTTREGIDRLIRRFYGGSEITLVKKEGDPLETLCHLHNSQGRIEGVFVIASRGLWRLFREADVG